MWGFIRSNRPNSYHKWNQTKSRISKLPCRISKSQPASGGKCGMQSPLQLSADPKWADQMVALLQHPQLHIRRAALMDLGASGWRPAAEAVSNCFAENSLKLIALRGLQEQPLGEPTPTTPGPRERTTALDG
jgi:hypothetical protein